MITDVRDSSKNSGNPAFAHLNLCPDLYQGKELLFISLTLPLENPACWNIASRSGSQNNKVKVNSILTGSQSNTFNACYNINISY